jgi:alkylhydroperoxidase family enzyme
MAWIRTVSDDEAQGRLGGIFRAAVKRAGRVSGVVRLMSLEPETLQASMMLYQASTTRESSPLSRWFRELVAATVSRLNQCHY